MESGELQYQGENLELNGEVITFNGGGTTCNDTPEEALFATETECGAERIRRLWALGYI